MMRRQSSTFNRFHQLQRSWFIQRVQLILKEACIISFLLAIWIWLNGIDTNDSEYTDNKRLWCKSALTRLIMLYGGFFVFRLFTVNRNSSSDYVVKCLAFLLFYELIIMGSIIRFYFSDEYSNDGVY